MKIRKPAVAGRFYPDDVKEIEKILKSALEKEMKAIDLSLAQKTIIGGVVPHAGYVFSSYQAVHFFEIVRKSEIQFDTIVIINPNHTGYGNPIAIDDSDFWETPFGKVEVDNGFKKLLPFTKSDLEEKAEHSGEVMVPYLQYFLPYEFKILPITMSAQTFDNAAKIAHGLHSVKKALNKNILIVASSDFTHFESAQQGCKLDQYVIDKILDMDSEGVESEVYKHRISVCGYGPIMTLMEYAKNVAADKAGVKILKRGHSGEVIPSNEVVDYVSMLFYH